LFVDEINRNNIVCINLIIYLIVLGARQIALSRFDYFPLTGFFDSKYALM